jgi:hypothetical protein
MLLPSWRCGETDKRTALVRVDGGRGGAAIGFVRMAWLDRWGTPAYLAFHAMIIWSTLFGRTIACAGRIHRLDSHQKVVKITGPGSIVALEKSPDHIAGRRR